jgi:UDPglucose 6-dehydrogenase
MIIPFNQEEMMIMVESKNQHGSQSKAGNESSLKIGIVGLGSVGSALMHVLSYFFKDDVTGYDIEGDYAWENVVQTDIVFICVSTPEKERRLDCSSVTDVLERLERSRYRGVCAIKSTLRVGFMESARAAFPGLRLVYSPEFLREKSRLQWSACPDRIVISGDERDVEVVEQVCRYAEDAKMIITDDRSAEVGKLAHNAFIACKVSFTNEMERISEKLGANPASVMGIIHADRRVKSTEHLQPGLGPYAGKCVPKDTAELRNAAGDSFFLDAVEKVNDETRERYRRRNEQSGDVR